MRASLVVVLAALLPGCALVDGLFGAELVTPSSVCDELMPQFEACGETATREECERGAACVLDAPRERCEGEYRDLVECVFDDGEAACSPDQGPCDFEFTNFVTCVANEHGVEALSCGGDIGVCDPELDPGCGEPCNPDDPSCGDCSLHGCPFPMVCNFAAGECELPPGEACFSTEECSDGDVCLSPAELCHAVPGRVGDPSVCNALTGERRCLRPCQGGSECDGGERCWPVPAGLFFDLDGGGAVCAPGLCSAGDGVCDPQGLGAVCVDDANGPGSGTCGVPCLPEDCADGVCDGCQPPAESCVPRELDGDGQALFLCAGDGVGLAPGNVCQSADVYRCEPGAFCRATPTGPRCAAYCYPEYGGVCPGGEPCEQVQGLTIDVCADGGTTTTCAEDNQCATEEVCRSPQDGCFFARNYYGVPDTACQTLSFERVCSTRCVPGEHSTCASGERCWPDPNAPTEGYCAPGGCAVSGHCGAPNVCFDVVNGGSSGLCGVPCDPSACLDGACDECGGSFDSSCWAVPGSTSPDYVCHPEGSGSEGQLCRPGMCQPQLACVPDDAGTFKCRRYCHDTEAPCASGATCELPQVLPDGVGTCEVDPSAACGFEITTCPLAGDTDGACIDTNALCPKDQSFLALADCSDIPNTPFGYTCALPCDPLTSGSCPVDEYCLQSDDPTVGYCVSAGCDADNDCSLIERCVVDDPHAGLCARECNVSNCSAGSSSCSDCTDGQHDACVPVRTSDGAAAASVCAHSDRRPLGMRCDRDEVAPCLPGHLCATDDDGVDRCLPLCVVSGDCSFGGACEPVTSSPPAEEALNVCRGIPGVIGDTCTDDSSCALYLCRNLDNMCLNNDIELETAALCSDPSPLSTSASVCVAYCARDEECDDGERCYVSSTLGSFCAANRCTSSADCTSPNVCADGVCGAPCDPIACLDGAACACNTTQETCTPLANEFDDEEPSVCRKKGSSVTGNGCQDTRDCVAGHVCGDPDRSNWRRCVAICSTTAHCTAWGLTTCEIPEGDSLGYCK